MPIEASADPVEELESEKATQQPKVRVTTLPKLSATSTATLRKRRMASVLDTVLESMKMPLLGRRQRRHPSLEPFAAVAGLTETKRAGTPFARFGTLTKARGDVFPRRGLVQS
jgi:hypothetical protein